MKYPLGLNVKLVIWNYHSLALGQIYCDRALCAMAWSKNNNDLLWYFAISWLFVIKKITTTN